MSRLLLLPALAGFFGCGNSCADICAPMADYARECGMVVTSRDIQDCRSANQGEVSQAQLDVCTEYSDPAKLREWWTCDDVMSNMSGAE